MLTAESLQVSDINRPLTLKWTTGTVCVTIDSVLYIILGMKTVESVVYGPAV